MGTRGIIARGTVKEFKGVYHHWDSYPEGLGRALYDAYHGYFKRDLQAMLKFLIDDHPGGWSTIVDRNFNLPVKLYRYPEPDTPCDICGKEHWRHYRQYYKEHGEKPPADPEEPTLVLGHSAEHQNCPEMGPTCYCHQGENSEYPKEWMLTQDNASSCGAEWGYLFGSDDIMTVIASYYSDGYKMVGMFGTGDPTAVWKVVYQVDLNSVSPPDWQRIHRLGVPYV